MKEPVEEIELKDNHVLRIYYDEDAGNPRTDFDNFGHMACWHSRYDLGDKDKSSTNHRWKPLHDSVEDMLQHITGLHPDDEEFQDRYYDDIFQEIFKKAQEKAVILPLGLYDHGGITMSVGKVSGWDYSNVGYTYVTEEEACKNWGKKSFDDVMKDWRGKNKGQKITVREAAERLLRGEVETYDQFLTGQVYGFQLVKLVPKTWVNKDDPEEEVKEVDEEEIDSCWGFYGDDWMTNGIADHVDNELFTKEQLKEIKQAYKKLEEV